MSNRHLYILSLLLCVVGLGVFYYKVQYLGFPIRPGQQTNLWEIEIKVNFTASDRPAKVLLYVPKNTKKYSIINENFISKGYGASISRLDSNRQVTWAKRRASGQQTLYYRALIEKQDFEEKSSAVRSVEVNPSEYEGADLEAAKAILDNAKQRSADVPTLVAQLIGQMEKHDTDDNVNLLLRGKYTDLRKFQAVIQILSLDNIPARLAHGLYIGEQHGDADPIPWLEVFTEEKWHAVDPITGQLQLAGDYLVLWRGFDRLVNVIGGEGLNVDINIKQSEFESIYAAYSREKLISPEYWKYSLSNLPLDTQEVYRILLLVPIGVFILVILRNVIGIKTFGTFMPVLIALSFRETQLLAGLILFSLIIAIGLGIRFYLEKLKLLLVPRLASVLIIVVLIMLAISIISHRLGLEIGLSVGLFPMVILTMTIERMSIVWEERGALEAMYQCIGSLLAASVTFFVMTIRLFEHLVTVFPELLLVLLAITLLFGRYSGYRLLELHRFKAVVSK